MTFEAATGPAPSFNVFVGKDIASAAALLPEAVAARLIQFGQRVVDLHAAMPPFEDVYELAQTKVRHVNRIAQLIKPRGDGGTYELAATAPLVLSEKRALERVERELARRNALKQTRGDRYVPQKQLEARIIDWITAGGIPAGCVLEDVVDLPESELLKKNERISDGIERYRHRLRELAADAHRVRSAPFPSKDIKAKLRQQIEALAERGRPNTDSAIEHNSPVSFAKMSLRSTVYNAAPDAVAFTEEAPDVLALLCFLFQSEIVQKIEAEIDACADDKAALSESVREAKLAEIAVDVLAVERMEVALIRLAESKGGEVVDYRHDTSAQALLGCRLITAPYREPDHGGHSFTVSHVGR